MEPTPALKWVDDPKAPGGMRLEPSDEKTWRFAVDGGKEYIRRVGVGYMDTSIYEGKMKQRDKLILLFFGFYVYGLVVGLVSSTMPFIGQILLGGIAGYAAARIPEYL